MCVQFGLGRRRGNVDRTSAANQRPTSGFYAGGRRVFALDVRASKKRRRRHFSICPAPFVAFGAGGSVAEFPLFVFWLFFFFCRFHFGINRTIPRETVDEVVGCWMLLDVAVCFPSSGRVGVASMSARVLHRPKERSERPEGTSRCRRGVPV